MPTPPRLLPNAPYWVTRDGSTFFTGLYLPNDPGPGFMSIIDGAPVILPITDCLQATLQACVFARDIQALAEVIDADFAPEDTNPRSPLHRMLFIIRRLRMQPTAEHPALITPIGPRLAFPDLDPEWEGSAAAFAEMFGPDGAALNARMRDAIEEDRDSKRRALPGEDSAGA